MHRFFLYSEDELSPDFRALRAGYPSAGGHDPNSELRIGQQARKIGQHLGARTVKLGNSSAPGPQIGSGFGLKSTPHQDIGDLTHIKQQS